MEPVQLEDDPVRDATAAVTLPEGVKWRGVFAVGGSGDNPWGVDVTIVSCSAGLSDQQFVDLSIAYARAIASSEAAEHVEGVISQMRVPDGAGSIN